MHSSPKTTPDAMLKVVLEMRLCGCDIAVYKRGEAYFFPSGHTINLMTQTNQPKKPTLKSHS